MSGSSPSFLSPGLEMGGQDGKGENIHDKTTLLIHLPTLWTLSLNPHDGVNLDGGVERKGGSDGDERGNQKKVNPE